MSDSWQQDNLAYDPEFQPPPDKDGPLVEPPTSKLAVVSLIFGVVGFFIPLVGPVVAIVTGHVARGDIKEARGRLGGGSLAKVGLILGYAWLILFVAAFAVFSTTIDRAFVTEEVRSSALDGPQWDVYATRGVKLANEVTPSYARWLEDRGLVGDDEPILCAFEGESDSVHGVEMAVITPRHVHYVKKDRVSTVDLADVSAVVHGDEYEAKYGDPNASIVGGPYPIALETEAGPVMRIQIDPRGDGPLFAEALTRAWESARNEEETTGETLQTQSETNGAIEAVDSAQPPPGP